MRSLAGLLSSESLSLCVDSYRVVIYHSTPNYLLTATLMFPRKTSKLTMMLSEIDYLVAYCVNWAVNRITRDHNVVYLTALILATRLRHDTWPGCLRLEHCPAITTVLLQRVGIGSFIKYQCEFIFIRSIKFPSLLWMNCRV